MSVFDLPRLHFQGVATVHPATGGRRGGLVGLASAGGRSLSGRHPADPVSAEAGRERPGEQGRGPAQGPAQGPGQGPGQGHLTVDAEIVGVECRPGVVDTVDPVVGRAVDLWGHRDDDPATGSGGRARVLDVDPASDWTTALKVGRFCFGRDGRTQGAGHMAIGAVHGCHPPRWHNSVAGDDGTVRRSVVHQFVVTGGEDLDWLDDAAVSPAVRRLRHRASDAGFGGLVVQFALTRETAAHDPGRPDRWRLRGTIAPWRHHEPRTYPAGRLLVPERRPYGRLPGRLPGRPHNLCVEATDAHVTLNMVTALPVPADLGDLELRTADSAQLVARIPRKAYLEGADALAGGLVTVPAELSAAATAAEALLLTGTGPDGPVVLLREKEINVQVDDACLLLARPDSPHDADQDVEVLMRSYVRGRPRPVGEIVVRQFFNPRALPGDPVAACPRAWSSDVDVVRLRPGRRDSGAGAWASSCVLDTDRTGRGWFTLRGVTAGAARVLLSTEDEDMPCAVDRDGSAARAYDHDDALGYWPGAGYLSARVLPPPGPGSGRPGPGGGR
ncbi:hypothetical protein [Streptomyces sp. NPDC048002]|uniref:hypothetical protein n=1 Tax=Streptomyces sp. NPDC048002 TaxID=3154344 RepID=UPI0033FB5679